MKIGIPAETQAGETRVAATPDSVKAFVKSGHDVVVEAGAGVRSSFSDGDYEAAGALVVGAPGEAWAADVVLKVRRPSLDELAGMRAGAALVGLVDPHGDRAMIDAYAKAGIDAYSMEFTPRITRAQSMDALSSQANLAGYRAVIEGAFAYGRGMPMMMTAAGTVAPAKVFVMGAGVAGLQAIATAKRLGAVVSATDVRPAAKEQVESLAAKFIAVEDEEFEQAQTSGGYAKEMSDAYKAKQAELVANHIAKQDMVITTALIPGRPAPKLVTAEMVATMRAGSVLVDLATSQGGNVAGAVADELVVTDNGVSIIGYANLPGRMAADASTLYAKNLVNFLGLITGEGEGAPYAPDFEDEIVKGMLLAHGGSVVHERFVPEVA